jgi:glycosyltransferase involved in cell wall biosynthesis
MDGRGAAPAGGDGVRYTVVVPVYNKAALLAQALASVERARAGRDDVELVVIDNESTDGSADVARTFHPAVVERSRGNVSRLRNLGVARGRGDRLVFVDSDVVVRPDYFARLDELFASGLADAYGCEYHLPDAPVWSERVWHELNVREDDGYRVYLNAGNFALPRDRFEAVGGFPEGFDTGEDTELCRNLVLAGCRIYQSQLLAAQHLGNPKTLGGFFRRLRWHGLSVGDGDRLVLRHKSTVMMLANAALVALGALVVLAAPGRPLAWGAAAALVLAVPVVTYVYRFATVRRFVNPLAALLLMS